ncbi:NF038104 family lipoprotein [Acinetobacter sp. NIPH 1852]|uniref:NF038104 family lipoprotein n=1 Tax=Acinetobacter sp. NIPH 1852 TaxID=2923428 RepID=UPI001F4ADB64|nr:NF038104 family lipoprotein [Acinetobacter sp. NIPH 1852]MCH7307909.1 NF038104 family lipoprotein [Acinetobacter sp. NIPH 1852]
MKITIRVIAIVTCIFMLQGCIHKVVTVPVKVAYKTTKGVVKGTAAVVGAVIPDGEDDKKKDAKD